MAAIYTITDGGEITNGLQGSSVSDQAIQSARRIASERDETVLLVDDDGHWHVAPNGSAEMLSPATYADAEDEILD